jgi:lysophospholipase L1-like esterase
VHINCGLHDLKRPFDGRDNQVPLEEYAGNLEEILIYLGKETSAQVIWGLTTPVNHVWHHQNKPFDRFEEDVVEYNQVAREIAAEQEVPVNDLSAVIVSAGRDELLKEDGVHFKPEGYALLGRAVADCIRGYLPRGPQG